MVAVESGSQNNGAASSNRGRRGSYLASDDGAGPGGVSGMRANSRRPSNFGADEGMGGGGRSRRGSYIAGMDTNFSESG